MRLDGIRWYGMEWDDMVWDEDWGNVAQRLYVNENKSTVK